LYLKGVAVQWTRTYFKNATGQEFAEQFVAAQDADVRKIFTDIKRAMYYPTNKTVVDKLVNNAISLSVKALTNADSTAVPLAPDGTSFNAADPYPLPLHGEHRPGRRRRHRRDQHRRRALQRRQGAGLHQLGAGDRHAGADRLHGRHARADRPGVDEPIRAGQRPRHRQFYNRQIGYFGNQAAEVWVKPWAVSGYVLVFMKGPRKPLAWRTRSGDSGGLELAAENETFPLRARQLVREYGISVWERTNGASLYIDTGGAAAFVAPTIS
jgi:hypothetical protein